MMLKLAVLCLLAVATGQFFVGFPLRVQGYLVEYDDRANILLLTNAEKCYIVEAPDAAWDTIATSEDDLQNAATAILKLVESNLGVTTLAAAEAASQYQSLLERTQCNDKDIYKVAYNPRS